MSSVSILEENKSSQLARIEEVVAIARNSPKLSDVRAFPRKLEMITFGAVRWIVEVTRLSWRQLQQPDAARTRGTDARSCD